MTRLVHAVLLAALAGSALAAGAQPGPDTGTAQDTPVPRVRGGDRLATAILAEAVAASPTVAGLVADLQRSDLVVTIVTGTLAARVRGIARIVAATGNVRHIRIILKIPAARPELVATLGHELCHAGEIAGMPDVRDDRSLAAAYRRVGVAMARDGFYETDTALRTGRLVAREVSRPRPSLVAAREP